MLSRRSLAIHLSKLDVFLDPKEELEQYPTDSNVAADIIHRATMLGDIEGKHILDLGAGTGILGIGALLNGAKKCTFLEIDADALDTLRRNLSSVQLQQESEVLQRAVSPRNADVVIMNPPFGSKNRHADSAFLDAAIGSAPVIYSIHKAETLQWVKDKAKGNDCAVTHTWEYDMPLKQTLKHHKQQILRTKVVAVRIEAQAL